MGPTHEHHSKSPKRFKSIRKLSNKYPHMTYDDEAKAIYIYLKETKPSKHLKTYTVQDPLFGNDIMADIDKDWQVTGIEILLSSEYNPNNKKEDVKPRNPRPIQKD